MTDGPDPAVPGDEEPLQGKEQTQPRKRKHKRATRPATGGDPAAHIPARAGRDDTDAGWAPDAPETGKTHRSKGDADRPESAQDRWWREQRPPHWE